MGAASATYFFNSKTNALICYKRFPVLFRFVSSAVRCGVVTGANVVHFVISDVEKPGVIEALKNGMSTVRKPHVLLGG